MFITLHPRDQWTQAKTQAELVELLEKELRAIPGQKLAFSQPIELRMNEMISGVRSDLGVKLFGDDFDVLTDEGGRDRAGAEDDRRQRRRPGRAGDRPAGPADPGQAGRDRPLRRPGQDGHSTWSSRSARCRSARWSRASSASRSSSGCRRSGGRARRRSASILVADAGRRADPARRGWPTIQLVEGPSTITREWGQRRITVTCNIRGRDMGSFVAEAQQKVAEQVRTAAGPLPPRVGRAVRELRAGPAPADDRRPGRGRADLRAALLHLPQRRRRAAGVHRRAVRLGRRHHRPVAAGHAVLDLGHHRLHRPVGRGGARRHDPGQLRPPAPAQGACRSRTRSGRRP